jgi:hypothetical protein
VAEAGLDFDEGAHATGAPGCVGVVSDLAALCHNGIRVRTAAGHGAGPSSPSTSSTRTTGPARPLPCRSRPESGISVSGDFRLCRKSPPRCWTAGPRFVKPGTMIHTPGQPMSIPQRTPQVSRVTAPTQPNGRRFPPADHTTARSRCASPAVAAAAATTSMPPLRRPSPTSTPGAARPRPRRNR